MLHAVIRFVLFFVGLTLPLGHTGDIEAGGFRITPHKSISAVLLALTLLFWVQSGAARKLPKNTKTTWIFVFFAGMAVASVTGFMNGADLLAIIKRWTTHFSLLGFYLIICYLVQTRKDLDILVGGVLLGGGVAVLSMLVVGEEGGKWGRADVALGGGGNPTAALLTGLLPIAFFYLTTSRRFLVKLVTVGLMAMYLGGIVLLMSRGALVGGLAIGGMWLLRFRRPQNLQYSLIFVCLLIVVGMLAPEAYFERVSSVFHLGQEDDVLIHHTEQRFTNYMAGIHAFMTSPIYGVGVANWRAWSGAHYPELGELNLHSSSIWVLAQAGLIGIIPFWTIHVLTWLDFSKVRRIAQALRSYRDHELGELYYFATLTQMGYLAIALASQFQPAYHWKGLWLSFGIGTVTLGLARSRAVALRQTSSAVEPDARDYAPLRTDSAPGMLRP